MNTRAWKPFSGTAIRFDHRAGLIRAGNNWRLLLATLWLVAVFRMVDLQIIGVLLESIRTELDLTDTQLGMLSGLSFALVYSLLGLPAAWVADRYNRVNIIAIALGLWSLMTMLCGITSGFATLFLARMGVGIGEAGGYAPSVALLHDRVPEENRGKAFSVLGSAIPFGVFCSFVLGALVLDRFGWRSLYIMIGLPGLVLAVFLWLTLDDEREKFPVSSVSWRDFSANIGELVDSPKLRWLLLASTCCMFSATGSGMWMPSFFMRVHALNTMETGLLLALIYGVAGIAGTLAGSRLVSRAVLNWPARLMRYCAYSVLTVPVLFLPVFISDSLLISCAALLVMVFLMHLNVGPLLLLVQECCTDKNRALAQSLNVLFPTLIGLSLGPLLVGVLSDGLSEQTGVASLPIAMILVLFAGYAAAATAFMKASSFGSN